MRPALLLAAALSCLVLTACNEGRAPEHLHPGPTDAGVAPPGPPTGGGDAAARLLRAPAATAAAGSARTSVVATVTGLPGRSGPVTFRGDGVIDFTAGRSRSVLAMDPDHDGASGGGTELESIVADGLLYVRFPALASLASASTPWVRLDPSTGGADRSGPGASAFGPLTDLAGSDVGAPIALLAGVDASSVHEVGTAVTRGASTTSLRATVDPTAATGEDTSVDDRAALEAFLTGIGARRLEVEVDLDEHDRLRRLVYEHDVPTPGGPAHQRFEMEYFDFGAAVEVSVPPDDQVRDLKVASQGPR